MERTYKYKIINKPLHPRKAEILFDLCEAFMTMQNYQRVANEDWQVLGEQCGVITIQNNHTFEVFECEIQNI